MRCEIVSLPDLLLGWFIWQRCHRPDLSVGVGVGAPHDLPLVFKHLDPTIDLTEFLDLRGPHLHDLPDIFYGHFCQGQIMTGGEADDPAGPLLPFSAEQGMGRNRAPGRVRQQGREVIVKNKGAGVHRISHIASPGIPRAEIT